MSLQQLDTRVSTWVLRAHHKLPDDLALAEYLDLVRAVNDLCRASGDRHARMLRAQYGSDFLMIVSITGSAAAVLVSISVVVKNLADSRKSNAEARKLSAEAKAAEERAKRAREIWREQKNYLEARSDATSEMVDRVRQLHALASEREVEAFEARSTAKNAENLTRRLDLNYDERRALPPRPDRLRISLALIQQLKESDPRLAAQLERRLEPGSSEEPDASTERLIEAIEQLASLEVDLDVESWGDQ